MFSGSKLEINFFVMSPQKQVTGISLVVKDSDMDSENLSSLIRLYVSDGQRQTVLKLYHL